MPKGEKLPNVIPMDTLPGEVAQDTALTLKLAELPAIDIKSPDAIRQRCQQYFDFCQEFDKRPGVQGLCLSLGIVRGTLINWENESSQRGEIVRRAKQVIRTLYETWAISGKMNPATSIFWAKNIMNYKDSISIEPVINNTLTADKTPEQIIAEIPVDED